MTNKYLTRQDVEENCHDYMRYFCGICVEAANYVTSKEREGSRSRPKHETSTACMEGRTAAT